MSQPCCSRLLSRVAADNLLMWKLASAWFRLRGDTANRCFINQSRWSHDRLSTNRNNTTASFFSQQYESLCRNNQGSLFWFSQGAALRTTSASEHSPCSPSLATVTQPDIYCILLTTHTTNMKDPCYKIKGCNLI